MIKSKRKEIDEISDMISKYKKVLIVGCGGCSSVCLSGGQKEVSTLMIDLKLSLEDDELDIFVDGYTIERQCNTKYYQGLNTKKNDFDAVLSMACGCGVQMMADTYIDLPVFPALDTVFMGVDIDIGLYQEKCRACGECIIGATGGICPITNCAKNLFNGPCGGTSSDKCEVNKNIQCAWHGIYSRLKAQGRLDDILKVHAPRYWKNQIVRSIVQDSYEMG